MGLFNKFFFNTEIPKNSLKYWFFNFTAYSREKIPIQLMLVIFVSRKKRFKLEYNGKSIEVIPNNNYAIVGWIFDKKMKKLSPQMVSVEFDGKINIKSNNVYFNLESVGKKLEIKAHYLGYKIFFSTLKMVNGEGDGYDSAFNNAVSGISQNYLTRAKINGRILKGSLFIQSLQSSVAIPWNWCRIAFSDKSYLGLSAFYLLTKKLRVISILKFYNSHEKKLYIFSIKKLHFSRGSWFIEAKNNSNWLSIELKTLSVESFKFKTFLTFNYNEHIVLVKNIRLKTSGKWKDLKNLGIGSGILEDTSGLLF